MSNHAYISRLPCGCICAWRPDHADEHTATWAAAEIQAVCSLERLPLTELQAKPDEYRPGRCRCPQPTQETLFETKEGTQ